MSSNTFKNDVTYTFFGQKSHTHTRHTHTHTPHTHTHIYIYIERGADRGDREREIVDFVKSNKKRKISGKTNKPNCDNGFSNDISSLLKRLSMKSF